MSLEERVMEQLKQAMRNKNEIALLTLRAIKAAILVEKTAIGGKLKLTQEEEIKLLQKMAKQRKESATIFRQKGRVDLAEKEEGELEVINVFLPAQLSSEELERVVRSVITKIGANSIKDMGKVIATASAQLSGRAEGKAISEKVKELLTAQ